MNYHQFDDGTDMEVIRAAIKRDKMECEIRERQRKNARSFKAKQQKSYPKTQLQNQTPQ